MQTCSLCCGEFAWIMNPRNIKYFVTFCLVDAVWFEKCTNHPAPGLISFLLFSHTTIVVVGISIVVTTVLVMKVSI